MIRIAHFALAGRLHRMNCIGKRKKSLRGMHYRERSGDSRTINIKNMAEYGIRIGIDQGSVPRTEGGLFAGHKRVGKDILIKIFSKK